MHITLLVHAVPLNQSHKKPVCYVSAPQLKVRYYQLVMSTYESSSSLLDKDVLSFSKLKALRNQRSVDLSSTTDKGTYNMYNIMLYLFNDYH